MKTCSSSGRLSTLIKFMLLTRHIKLDSWRCTV